MKAISTLVTLLLIVTATVTSEILYQSENYILSAALFIVSILSLSLLINSAEVNLLNTENHAQ